MVFHYPRACDQKDSPLMGETERIKWGLITEKLGKGSIYQQTSYQLSHPMQELWPQLHWLQILHQSLVVWLMLARSLEFVSGKNLCLPSCSPEKRLHRHCQQMQATLSKIMIISESRRQANDWEGTWWKIGLGLLILGTKGYPAVKCNFLGQ